jgi:ribosomal-protein-alanine N-acetyltransferase
MAVRPKRKSNGRPVTDAPYRIRPVQPADLTAVQAIERASFSDPWSLGDFTDALDWPVVFLIAQEGGGDGEDGGGGGDGRVIGYVVARGVAGEGEILNIAVDSSFRGRGIACALIRHTLTRLALLGVGSVYLEVRESNRAARSLYERLGFSEVGRRRGYYRRPREDAVLLRAAIPVADQRQ